MNNANSISVIKNIPCKPSDWQLWEDADGWRLRARWVREDDYAWFNIVTARGEQKIYRTSKAALADIKRVDNQAVVYMDFWQNNH